jgi:aspartate aminotransferase
MAALRDEGYPVDFIEPQGAIYLSVRFNLVGRKTAEGKLLENNEDIRNYLTEAAGFALVPFAAFGADEADQEGWSRASVGAASVEQLHASMPRLREALASLS